MTMVEDEKTLNMLDVHVARGTRLRRRLARWADWMARAGAEAFTGSCISTQRLVGWA
jgi:hypothetical protein